MPGRAFQADPRWGTACDGYHVQARPDAATAAAFASLQQEIASVCPMPLHLVPATALHISVFTLIPPQPPSLRVNEDWRRIRDAMQAELDPADLAGTTVSIPFQRLSFTPTAVIVVTREQPPIHAAIRDQFGRLLEGLALPAPRYDQTHVTIARYAASAQIDAQHIGSIERDDLGLVGHFEPVRLVRELCYPSLTIQPV